MLVDLANGSLGDSLPGLYVPLRSGLRDAASRDVHDRGPGDVLPGDVLAGDSAVGSNVLIGLVGCLCGLGVLLRSDCGLSDLHETGGGQSIVMMWVNSSRCAWPTGMQNCVGRCASSLVTKLCSFPCCPTRYEP